MSGPSSPPGRLKRTPTDSPYYSCEGLLAAEPSQTTITVPIPWWMHADDASHQVANAPSVFAANIAPGPRYPNRFQNHEGLPLQAVSPVMHYPLLKFGPWVLGMSPGSVRAFYNDANRLVFDVGYHDPRKISSLGGYTLFSLAVYHLSSGDNAQAKQ